MVTDNDNFYFINNEGLADHCGTVYMLKADIPEHDKRIAEQARKDAATFEEIKDFLISKSGTYKSEYIQSAIIMLRDCFGSRAAILTPLQNVGNSEQIPTERNKLDIAVKTLEYFANYSGCEASGLDMRDMAEKTLKDIQG